MFGVASSLRRVRSKSPDLQKQNTYNAGALILTQRSPETTLNSRLTINN